MKWIKGHLLLEPPYNLTILDIFEDVKNRRITPYIDDLTNLYPDPDEPPGMKRYFYFREGQEVRNQLAWCRYQRGWLKSWLAKTDEEIRADVVEYPSIQDTRTRFQEDLEQWESKIKELEAQLAAVQPVPERVSAQMQEKIVARLLECAFCQKEVDGVFELVHVKVPNGETEKSEKKLTPTEQARRIVNSR